MHTNDKELFDHIIERGKRIEELKKENQYDPKILNFYKNGSLIIKGMIIPITKVNVVEDDKKNQFIDIVDKHFVLPENIVIKKITSFRDTSLFQISVEKYKDKIKNNQIELTDEMLKELLTSKWDGKYHTLTPEAALLQEKNR